jgi:hypothetical protein
MAAMRKRQIELAFSEKPCQDLFQMQVATTGILDKISRI